MGSASDDEAVPDASPSDVNTNEAPPIELLIDGATDRWCSAGKIAGLEARLRLSRELHLSHRESAKGSC